MPGPAQRPPAHLRRERLARRVRLLFAIGAAAFVFYRIYALYAGR